MSSSKYHSNRPSGVEGLGDLPEHWKISRLGYESWVRARLGWKGLKAEEYVDEGYAFLATPNIKGKAIDFTNVNFIDQFRYDESPEIKLRIGDVLLAKDGSTLGTVNIVRHLPVPATVNSSIAVITPNSSLDSIYCYYLFQSSFLENAIRRIKGGMGVPHLFQEDLNRFYVPIPPASEQTAIAAFLDRETGKIDALVEEQKRLIELLKEKRQAVIFYAVTKGLDPTAPMKDSGVEWLGDVPEHWEVSRLDRTCEFRNGKAHEPFFSDGGPYVCVTARFVSTDGEARKLCTEQLCPAARNDILMVMSDLPNGRALARAFLVGEGGPYAVNQRVCALTAREANPAFLFFQLDRNPGLLRHDDGMNQTHLSNHDFLKLPVLIPPLHEQRQIAERLSELSDRSSRLISSAEAAITLLQERRAALISAVVTGKIDVSEFKLSDVAA